MVSAWGVSFGKSWGVSWGGVTQVFRQRGGLRRSPERKIDKRLQELLDDLKRAAETKKVKKQVEQVEQVVESQAIEYIPLEPLIRALEALLEAIRRERAREKLKAATERLDALLKGYEAYEKEQQQLIARKAQIKRNNELALLF